MIRWRAEASRDGGFSLPEMLVVIMLLALVMGSISTVVVTSLQKQSALANRGTVLAQMRSALEVMDRDIRSANPLCYATGTRIVMLETYPTQLKLIADYQVSGTKLIYNEYRTDTAGSTTTSANSNPSCVYTDSETGVTTTYYEATPAVTRTVVYNLVAGSEPFKSPVASASYATSIATCPTTGTIPAATSTVAASTISLLTVKLSVKPAKQHTPVSASDCGIRLRNYLPTS